MKKLSFILLSMALSTSLSAQTMQLLSLGNEATSTTATNSTDLGFQAGKNQTEAVTEAFAPEAGILAYNGNTTASHFGPGPSVSKKKNFNRGYTVADAVVYNTAIGVRVGAAESGLTAKHFFSKNGGIEGILSTSWPYRGTRLTALYQLQKPIGQDGYYWYWGVGAHVGMYKDNYWHKSVCSNGIYEQDGKPFSCDEYRTTFGIDGILGVEYHFTEAPFTISLDIKPSYDLLIRSRQYGDVAISARYAF